ncbi:MAG TPA: hypothetical protein VMM55_10380 [Thermohalobaculum sp.]|nr:hypothetical protein [Thermohalobaculum sp.]
MGLISDIALALDRRFLSVLLRGLALTVALLAGVTWLVVWLVTLLPDSLGTWPSSTTTARAARTGRRVKGSAGRRTGRRRRRRTPGVDPDPGAGAPA